MDTEAPATPPPAIPLTGTTTTAKVTVTPTELNNNSTKSPGRSMWEKAVKRIRKIVNLSKRPTELLSSPLSTPMQKYK